ncbi:MAG: hypothetical protein F6K11_05690 [Leptolyngbya sp. SIO3F4]|nr:hypothetical protein [Leptolyngbya sp. SIO3F4]
MPITLNDDTGNIFAGGNGTDGDLVLQDGSGRERVHLGADGQRMELHNTSGDIISMIGGGANMRLGTNGQNGDVYLYRSNTSDIFNNSQACIRVEASNGNIYAGGQGVDGDLVLEDGSGRERVHLSADSQRMELHNTSGDIISMIGGGANMRLGTNGQNGDIYLYRSNTSDIFNNSQACIRVEASNGNIYAGGQGVDGDLVLEDGSGRERVHLSADSQRMELHNTSGDIISMIGGGANMRLGTNGQSGDIYLYPSNTSDIFNNDQASIHLNGQTGDIILQNADCAEDFEVDTLETVEPGTVMAISDSVRLRVSDRAYDHRVAGIVAGAGEYRPGIILGRKPGGAKQQLPIALMGRVCCKVDANYGAIQVGDLLTTSATPGHAMKVTDSSRAFGTVIGKALGALEQGQGLIPVLVTLQ